MAANVVYVGSKTPVNVSITDLPNGLKMSGIEFTSTFYVSGKLNEKSVEIAKSAMLKIDDDNYLAYVDTTNMSAGELKVKTDATYQNNGIDITEVLVASTGINLKKVS